MWHAFLAPHKSSLSRSNPVMAYYALVDQPGNSLTGGETDDDNLSPEWKLYLDAHHWRIGRLGRGQPELHFLIYPCRLLVYGDKITARFPL